MLRNRTGKERKKGKKKGKEKGKGKREPEE